MPPELENNIFVKNRFGEVYAVNREQAKTAIENGWSQETPEETIDRERRKEFGERPIASFLAGGARMGSLGLSDYLAPKGLQETMKGLEEYNPGASTLGEYTLGLAPLLLGGGGIKAGGAAAKGLRGLAEAAPISILSKAGRGVEAALAGKPAAKGLAGQILEKAVPKAVGYGVEGAGFAAGNLISEAALGNPDLTAENVTAQIGLGALLGGGLGGFVGVGGAVLPKALQRMKDAIPRPDSLSDLWNKTIVRGGELVSTKPPGLVRKFVGATPEGAANRDIIMMSQAEKNQKIFNYFEEVSKFDEGILGLNKEGLAAKTPMFNEMMKDVPIDQPLQALRRTIMDIDERFAEIKLDKSIFGAKPDLSKFKEFRTILKEELEKGRLGEKTTPELFDSLNNVRKNLRSYNQEIYGKGSLEQKALSNQMRRVYDNMSSYLEDSGIWGPAGKLHSDIQGALAEFYQSQTPFRKLFGKGKIDFKKFNSFAKKLDTPEGGELQKIFDRYTNASTDLIDTLETSLKGSYGLKTGHLEKLSNNLLKQNQEIKKMVGTFREKGELAYGARGAGETIIERGAGFAGGLVGGVAGSVAGAMGLGPIGAAAGFPSGAYLGKEIATGLARLMTNPVKTAELMGAISKANIYSTKRLKGAVSGFMGKAGKVKKAASNLKPLARPTTLNAILQTNQGDKKERSNGKNLDALRTRLSELESNPKMVDQLIQSEGLIDVPELQKAIKKTLMKKIKFANQIMPKNPNLDNPMLMGLRKWELSSEDMAKFNAYLEAIDDPNNVIDDFEKGMPSIEGIEALKETSPEIFVALQKEVMEQAVELKDELPYEKRLVLSQLFNLPIESSLDPFNYNYLQQGYVDKMMGEEQVTQEMRKTGANINLASREKTDVEQFTDRNRG